MAFPLALTIKKQGRETLVALAGELTVFTPEAAWRQLTDRRAAAARGGGKVVFDLAGLTALDLNGSAQLLTVLAAFEKAGAETSVEALPEGFSAIFDLAAGALAEPMVPPEPRLTFFSEWGQIVAEAAKDLRGLIAFTGELAAEFVRAALRPSKIPWKKVLNVAETAGVNAAPVVCLVSGLVGLIIAFQAAMLMKIFGAEIYVADLIGLSVVRELGPLIAGIMLAGRSGSAFSAELGAMKAAEEVDAIITMGLSPVRELALPRVLATVLTTPLVALLATFVGIMGGSVVLLNFGYSLAVFWEAAVRQVSLASYFIGVGKSFVFGFTLAAVGCQRGLAAGDGPGAVGRATTSGVVVNIVLIAVLDSVFAVLFYVLQL
ncbi:MAG: ABC transporter permease [Candidatus Adiutrix sp.]|jgi:phospholipid/cholesterol/gamma-HCH transport system permease protein|nr:ABC transporter permease [Candidatus Adiutrix sp.]